jgi:hypothetical protein
MKSMRLIVVAVMAAASLGLGAASVSACQPERPCPPCSYNETWNKLMRLLGHPC